MSAQLNDWKTCPSCGVSKPSAEYGRHKGNPGKGVWKDKETYCKPCIARKQRARMLGKKPVTFPDPIPFKNLAPVFKAMMPETADAFEKFFNHFAAPLTLTPFAKQWVALVLSERNLLLNVPPRHAKSTVLGMWFPLWQFARNRNAQILVISKTTTLGAKLARKIAHHLESDIALNQAFGKFQENDRPWRVGNGELEIAGRDRGLRSGDLSLQIRGARQQVLGMEADWVIADDVTDRRVAKSEAESNDESEWFHGEVLSRLNPQGHAVCIGQRVHANDLYGQLQQEVDDEGALVWHHVTTPAILDYVDKTTLWPEVWNYESLMRSRARLGSDLFESYYQQNPAEAGMFVPRHWIDGGDPGCLDYDRPIGRGWKPDEKSDEYIPVTRVLSIDPSPTRFAGMVVADIIYFPQSPTFWCSLVDVRRDKMGLREMLETVEELQLKYRPTYCIIEENSVKWLHEDPAWQTIRPMFQSVISHNTGRNKADPEMGVWSLASDFEAGRIRLPYSDVESRSATESLVREVLAYPNGQTDDVLMALWFIKFNYKKLRPRDPLQRKMRWRMASGNAWGDMMLGKREDGRWRRKSKT